jgi:K+-transporting ATPase ATPase C chain
MKDLITQLRTSLIATILLALILCGVYPAVVWGIAQFIFPHKANGSLILRPGKIIGSELLGQYFSDPKYFHPRPSAAGEVGYDGARSGGSNLGPTSKRLIEAVQERVERYRSENGLPQTLPVPADAVTASASGLDPHISVKNAELQARRVAKARGLTEEHTLTKVRTHTEGRDFGVLGEPRVNVLKLNLSLDAD